MPPPGAGASTLTSRSAPTRRDSSVSLAKTSGWPARSCPTLLSPQTTKSGRWPASVAVSASPAARRSPESAMSPGCTNTTRTAGPPAGDGPSRYQAGPSAAHATRLTSATMRPGASRCTSAATTAVLAATRRKLVSHTPPKDADASVTGWLDCDAPSDAHGPPSQGQDRTTSAATHALGNTTRAATVRPTPTGADSSRCANHPHGSHSAPNPMASNTSSGPTLVASQYCVDSTNPATPHHARTDASQGVGAARTTNNSGTRPNQASHHHDGAGKASAGSAPTTNAAARPGMRCRQADTKSRLGRVAYRIRSDTHGQRSRRHGPRYVGEAGGYHRIQQRPGVRADAAPVGRRRRRRDGDPQSRQRGKGDRRKPRHRSRRQADHQTPGPVVAGRRRRVGRTTQRRGPPDRHPDQQRRRHDATGTRHHRRRLRIAVRQQPSRALRADRPPAAAVARGQGRARRLPEQPRGPHERENPLRRPTIREVLRADVGLRSVEAGGVDVRPRTGPAQPRGGLGHHVQRRAPRSDQDQSAGRRTLTWPRKARADGAVVQGVLALDPVPLAGNRRRDSAGAIRGRRAARRRRCVLRAPRLL